MAMTEWEKQALANRAAVEAGWKADDLKALVEAMRRYQQLDAQVRLDLTRLPRRVQEVMTQLEAPVPHHKDGRLAQEAWLKTAEALMKDLSAADQGLAQVTTAHTQAAAALQPRITTALNNAAAKLGLTPVAAARLPATPTPSGVAPALVPTAPVLSPTMPGVAPVVGALVPSAPALDPVWDDAFRAVYRPVVSAPVPMPGAKHVRFNDAESVISLASAPAMQQLASPLPARSAREPRAHLPSAAHCTRTAMVIALRNEYDEEAAVRSLLNEMMRDPDVQNYFVSIASAVMAISDRAVIQQAMRVLEGQFNQVQAGYVQSGPDFDFPDDTYNPISGLGR